MRQLVACKHWTGMFKRRQLLFVGRRSCGDHGVGIQPAISNRYFVRTCRAKSSSIVQPFLAPNVPFGCLIWVVTAPNHQGTALLTFRKLKTSFITNQWQATQLFVVASFESNYKSIITKIILNIVIVIANHFRVLTACHSEHFLDVPDKQQTWRNKKTGTSAMQCFVILMDSQFLQKLLN